MSDISNENINLSNDSIKINEDLSDSEEKFITNNRSFSDKINTDSNITNQKDKENNSNLLSSTSKENLNLISKDEENNTNNNLSFLFTSAKAGMQGLDRDKINKIIQESTKDSIITKHKNEEFEKVKNTVDSYKKKLNSFHKSQNLIEHNKKIVEQKIKEIETLRNTNRIWMHLDMDMFYAAIEIRDNPELKEIPIAIGDERMVSTSNYIARKFGVRSAMPGFLAKKLCPQLTFVPCSFHKYKKESESIMNILREYDINLDIRGLDEAFLDLTEFAFKNYIAEEKEFEALIKEIKAKILDETKLTCSIGISTNKMLAKICSDLNKPDGYKILLTQDISEIKDFMKSMLVRKIPFVGEKMEQKLNMLGIKNCENILEKSVDLFYILRYNTFEFLIMSALGISESVHKKVRESINKSVSCSETFLMTKDIHKIKDTFNKICKRMYETMLKQSIVGKNLTIEIKDKNDKMVSKVMALKKYFETENEINRNGWNLLNELMNNSAIRLIRMKLSGLSKTNPDALRKKKDNVISKWLDNLKFNKIKNEIYANCKIEEKEKENNFSENDDNNFDKKEELLNTNIKKKIEVDKYKLPSMKLLSVRKTSGKKDSVKNNITSSSKDIKLLLDEMSKSQKKINFKQEKNKENSENKILISTKKHKKENKILTKKANNNNYFNINEMMKVMNSKSKEGKLIDKNKTKSNSNFESKKKEKKTKKNKKKEENQIKIDDFIKK